VAGIFNLVDSIAKSGIIGFSMRPQLKTCLRLLMALLFTLSAFAPSSVQAEAVMRCAGSAPNARPCARVLLPAATALTSRAADSLRMACCRSHCQAMPPNCAAMGKPAAHLAAPCCLISVRCVLTTPTPLLAGRGSPLLPHLLFASVPPAAVYSPRPATYFLPCFSPLSPHVLPAFHGLRAPPAV